MKNVNKKIIFRINNKIIHTDIIKEQNLKIG